jgi:hypothetical protein
MVYFFTIFSFFMILSTIQDFKNIKYKSTTNYYFNCFALIISIISFLLNLTVIALGDSY